MSTGRTWAAAAAVAVVTVASGLSAGATAVAGGADGRSQSACDRPGARTIVANRFVEVAVLRRSQAPYHYGCDRVRGSSVVIAPRFFPSPYTGSSPEHFRLAGRRLAYEEYIPAEEDPPEFRLVLHDFGRRTRIAVRAYDERPRSFERRVSDGVRDIALSRRGVAWTVAFYDPVTNSQRVAVNTLAGRSLRRLAIGHDIDPVSLGISGCRADWRQSGVERSADVCGR